MQAHTGSVLRLKNYKPCDTAPLMIFVNLQKEFLLEGRPLQIKNSGAALANCRRLLEFARAARLSIAHVRLFDASFHHARHGAEWIDDFRPYGSEMVFERDSPSCYGSGEFSEMMEQSGGGAAFLAGLGGSTACLATLIDAERRRHKMEYIFDASSSNARFFDKEETVHEAAVQLASQFVDLVSTSEALQQFARSVGA